MLLFHPIIPDPIFHPTVAEEVGSPTDRIPNEIWRQSPVKSRDSFFMVPDFTRHADCAPDLRVWGSIDWKGKTKLLACIHSIC